MTTTTYVRYELLRTFRNRRFFLISLLFPLVLFLLIAGPNRDETLQGIPFATYYMAGMVSWGAMAAVIASGARIAAERAIGWTRQLRISPLPVRTYFGAKLAGGYTIAIVSIAVLYVAGTTLGVRLTAAHWLEMTGLILLGLVPFAVLGILLGHVLTIDSMGPAIGGVTSLFALLGGAWGPVAGSGVLNDVARLLPSYWLVQAAQTAYGGDAWPAEAWLVLVVWTAGLAALAVLAYRRDTGAHLTIGAPGRSVDGVDAAPVTRPGIEVLYADAADWGEEQRRWARGWRSIIFPGVFLLYLAQAAHGIGQHSSGWAAVLGWTVLVGFCAAYLAAMRARWAGRLDRFWALYGLLVVLFVVEAPIAHEDAFVMCVYLVISALGPRAFGVIVLLAAATFVPAMVPSWDVGIDVDIGVTILLVSMAMFAFSELLHANRELSQARSEVAQLAAEGERTRIARDLHDLLGHSLTTITIKAGLARRLTASDPARAAAEIAEVEDIARRSLTDVRAAVSGYREVTLAGELAAAGEVLRAAGIAASLPRSVDELPDDRQQLFGWVVREGVTNVVRHARARCCTITVGPDWVEVADDGLSEGALPGNGLIGLGERVAAAGGRVLAGPWARADGSGWRLRVELTGSA